jgi:hypothetical protein
MLISARSVAILVVGDLYEVFVLVRPSKKCEAREDTSDKNVVKHG